MGLTKTQVINFSPALANKVALNTSLRSIGEIAGELAEVTLELGLLARKWLKKIMLYDFLERCKE